MSARAGLRRYQRGWTTLGIVAGWAMLILGLSYDARTRIGRRRWRTLHRFTALAKTALEAEIRAKAAVLSGPDRAAEWLPDGGVVVRDGGSVEVLSAARRARAAADRSPGRAARPSAA